MGSLQNPQEERAGVSTRAAERKRRRREDETSPERERRQIGSRERMRTFRARIRGEPEAAEMAVREAGRLRRRRAEERDAERTGRRRVQWEHGRSIGQNVASMSRPETVQENYLGLMNKECEFCHALFFESEVGRDPHRINVCCNYGTVQLSDTFGDYPEILQQLFTTDSERAKNFRDNIRRFNSALAMASMGAQLDIPVGRGPYCFRVHGQVYHLAGPLHPAPGQRPAYGQIYILDSEQAAEERLNNLSNANCDRQVMTELGSLFACINPFAGAYKMMAEVERDEEEKAALEGRPVTRIKMIFDTSLNTDQRRYNIPTSNEVAVIYVGEDDDIPATRSLAVHPRSGDYETSATSTESATP
uniref:Helitron helicase-like domain-containing protein n=1 Tax=Trichuris muris TaxID=70415 RepID=A0A5S6QHG9_TRIMR